MDDVHIEAVLGPMAVCREDCDKHENNDLEPTWAEPKLLRRIRTHARAQRNLERAMAASIFGLRPCDAIALENEKHYRHNGS